MRSSFGALSEHAAVRWTVLRSRSWRRNAGPAFELTLRGSVVTRLSVCNGHFGSGQTLRRQVRRDCASVGQLTIRARGTSLVAGMPATGCLSRGFWHINCAWPRLSAIIYKHHQAMLIGSDVSRGNWAIGRYPFCCGWMMGLPWKMVMIITYRCWVWNRARTYFFIRIVIFFLIMCLNTNLWTVGSKCIKYHIIHTNLK